MRKTMATLLGIMVVATMTAQAAETLTCGLESSASETSQVVQIEPIPGCGLDASWEINPANVAERESVGKTDTVAATSLIDVVCPSVAENAGTGEERVLVTGDNVAWARGLPDADGNDNGRMELDETQRDEFGAQGSVGVDVGACPLR